MYVFLILVKGSNFHATRVPLTTLHVIITIFQDAHWDHSSAAALVVWVAGLLAKVRTLDPDL